MNISALILTKNEEKMIDDCLRQLDFVDEIIILDQNSKDKTRNIAQKYTKKIIQTSNTNFAKNREKLAKEAKGKWLLYIDSDERYSYDLKQEILKSTLDNNISTYYISRKNMILGEWMQHGGFWPDYVPKLFYKKNLKGWHGEVHESPNYLGKSAKLVNPLIHLTARNISDMFEKTIKWAQIEANLAYKAQHPKVNLLKIVLIFTTEFISRYFFKLGLLDGAIGFMQSIFQSYHRAISMVYLWELQTKSKEKFKQLKNV